MRFTVSNDRLTIRNSDGSVSKPNRLRWADILEKLAAYEDAEEQARLIILPCRISDTVYVLEDYYAGKKLVRTEVEEAQIDGFIINGYGKPMANICTDGGSWYEIMDFEAGDYFLTRAEAEAALGGEAK